jgi:phosphoglycerate dehydrogenase-like enzyme
MAEATILLVLALLYRLHDAEAALKRGDWAGLVYGGMLRDKTVGLIGLGGISRAIIKRLQGWNCRLLVHSRSTDAPPGVALAGLDELTAASDVIVVITSLSAETHHLLNRERLAKMKPHAILVNTSRGAIIEEDALVEILQAGKIAGAALDAFEVEPLAVDHPLRKLTNVILTPHAIGHTREAAEAVPLRAMENVLALAAGTLPASCKNPEVAANWPRIATT